MNINRSTDSSRFTSEDEKNNAVYLQDRPAILVSSTSWSEDENFALLFDALKSMFGIDFIEINSKDLLFPSEYAGDNMKNLPSIVCIVTGKGPLKEQFIQQVERERDQYQHVEFCFPWLDPDDYPLLLGKIYLYVSLRLKTIFIDKIGCADVGVSLHQSSSSFDLPMKVVDMFAVGVPVCSVKYEW